MSFGANQKVSQVLLVSMIYVQHNQIILTVLSPQELSSIWFCFVRVRAHIGYTNKFAMTHQ